MTRHLYVFAVYKPKSQNPSSDIYNGCRPFLWPSNSAIQLTSLWVQMLLGFLFLGNMLFCRKVHQFLGAGLKETVILNLATIRIKGAD